MDDPNVQKYSFTKYELDYLYGFIGGLIQFLRLSQSCRPLRSQINDDCWDDIEAEYRSMRRPTTHHGRTSKERMIRQAVVVSYAIEMEKMSLMNHDGEGIPGFDASGTLPNLSIGPLHNPDYFEFFVRIYQHNNVVDQQGDLAEDEDEDEDDYEDEDEDQIPIPPSQYHGSSWEAFLAHDPTPTRMITLVLDDALADVTAAGITLWPSHAGHVHKIHVTVVAIRNDCIDRPLLVLSTSYVPIVRGNEEPRTTQFIGSRSVRCDNTLQDGDIYRSIGGDLHYPLTLDLYGNFGAECTHTGPCPSYCSGRNWT